MFGQFWRHDPADTGRLDGWLAFGALCGQAFRFHLGFVILLAVAAALLARARRAAVLLVVLLIPTLGARAVMYAPWRGGVADPDAPGITVMSANLLFGRGSVDALIDQIDATDPDVVLFQEYTPASSEYEAALRARYPHFVVWPRDDAFGQAVFSRLAFVGEPELWRGPEGSVIPMIACEVRAGGRRVAVWNVHTLPPVGSRYTIEQRRMVAWIAERAAALLGGDRPPDGLVIAGDFNAPFGTNHLRELSRAGLREAHAEVGTDAGSTWPRLWWKRYFPGIRLDQVVFGGGLRPVWSAVGTDFGSDHRPVSARLVFD